MIPNVTFGYNKNTYANYVKVGDVELDVKDTTLVSDMVDILSKYLIDTYNVSWMDYNVIKDYTEGEMNLFIAEYTEPFVQVGQTYKYDNGKIEINSYNPKTHEFQGMYYFKSKKGTMKSEWCFIKPNGVASHAPYKAIKKGDLL